MTHGSKGLNKDERQHKAEARATAQEVRLINKNRATDLDEEL